MSTKALRTLKHLKLRGGNEGINYGHIQQCKLFFYIIQPIIVFKRSKER